MAVTSSSTSDRGAYFRALRPIFWIGLFLASLEIGLEYRAYLKGWDTPLFGAVRSEHGRSKVLEGSMPAFGPTADFPFRGPVVKGPVPAHTLRIWVASASHGEDIYLPPDVIFPTLIGKKLQLQGLSAQVLNASRAGKAIEGDLALLRREFDQWRPNMVVLYQLSLDIGILSRRYLGPARSKASGRKTDVESPTSVGSGSEPSWGARLFKESTAYSLLNANVTTRLSAAQLLSDDIGSEAREAFRRTLLDFVDGVRALGAEPVLCTFAIGISPTAPAPPPRDLVLYVHRWNEHLSVRGWLAAVEQLNSVIRDVAKDRRVLLVDAAAVLTGREDMFRDPVHFTPAGHSVLAGTIASALSHRTGRK